jgi:S1-C subfamily serine protease
MDMSGAYQLALKLLVSGILLWIALLCVWGMVRIWRPAELVYRTFVYTRDGSEDGTAGMHFTHLVNHEIRRLNRMLSPPPGADAPLSIPTASLHGGQIGAVDLPQLPESLLPSVEIHAYGIQLSALVNRLVQQIRPPNEVVGTVAETKGRFDAYVELRRAGGGEDHVERVGLASQHGDKHDAAFAVACRVYRMLATEQKMVYALASDAEFEVFARALQQYDLYRASLAEIRPPAVAETALKETERLLDGLIQQKSRFPLVYKLAAQIAYSKGQMMEAIAHLESYKEVWPPGLPEDREASQLLARYKEELKAGEQVAAVAAAQGAPDLRSRQRPVRPGISASSSVRSAGTICCLVRDKHAPDGALYILSAAEVFGTRQGTPVLQPGTADGARPAADVIGYLDFRAAAAEQAATPGSLGALARLTVEAEPATPYFPFAGTASPQIGQTVRKVGRTTGMTQGTVTEIDATVNISTSDGVRTFHSLTGVRGSGFSAGGDSGAPVVDEQNRLIGMVYAGSAEVTYIAPIIPILEHFHVELVK